MVNTNGLERKRKHKPDMINRRSGGQKVMFCIMFFLLFLYSITLVYPFWWLFQTSLKTSLEYFTSSSLSFAAKPQWFNYVRVFEVLKVKDSNFFIMVVNSIWWTLGGVFLQMFSTSVVAYCLSKYKFGARKVMYTVIIFMMVFPIFGAGAAAYKQAQDLGIYDSPLLLVKSMGGYGGMAFLVLYAFFSSLPWDYAEAAFIDGANDYDVFFRIMLPMAKGSILSMAIVATISRWNDYNTPLLYLPSYPTLATGLYLYESDMTLAVDYPLYFTGILLSILPILTLFIIFQDAIMNNVTIGGLKG